MGRVPAVVAAVGSGLLLDLAFPGVGWWPLAPVAVAVLLLAVVGRGVRWGLLLGLLHGMAFFVPHVAWSGIYVGPMPWLALATLESVYLAVFGGLATWVLRCPGGTVVRAGAVACLWVAQEALRSRTPFGGFSWGRLAFSQADAPTLGLAALGGAPLVSFAVALVGALLAQAVLVALRRGLTPSRWATRGPAAAVLVATAAGVLGVGALAPRPTDAAAVIDGAAEAVGAPVLVGTLLREPADKLSNVSMVWDPVTGPGAQYIKRRPVPFAEYVPYRSFFRRITDQVDLVRTDFVAGQGSNVLDVGPARAALAICFEVAFDDQLREGVRDGADLLVVQTNNATFGRTDESVQQLAMSRLRAVELGRSVAHVSTVGVSALIAPDGSMTQVSGHFTQETLVDRLPLRDELTLATRLGAWPEGVLMTLGLLGAAAGVLVQRQRRRTQPAHHSPRPVRHPVPTSLES